MQLAVFPDAGRTVLQAVQDNPGFSHSRLAWTDHRTPPPSPSSTSSIGGRAAASRLKLKPTPGLCSSGPVEKTLYQEKRGASSAGEVEKSKPQSAGPPQQNSSMDLITEQYLCGQWPREHHHHHHHQPQRTCMTDKATQTPVFWSDDLEGLSIHKRSASWSSAEHREEQHNGSDVGREHHLPTQREHGQIAKLCEQLRRSVLGIHRNKESPESPSLSLCSQVQTKLPPVSSTSMSVTKPAVCRVSSYNDSINRELESVFLSDTCRQQERELQDGRCAPVPPHQNSDHHTQSTDAQLSISDHHCPHLFPSAADAPHGTEPFTNRSECGEGCDCVNESSSPLPPLASSPKPNNSFIFKRVPPEGCEKIKVFEETFSCRTRGFPIFSCPDRNKVSFIPTGSGPFCPVRQPGSSFCPSDCRPASQNVQPTGQFKPAGGQDCPPSHCFSSYRTQHC